MYAVYEDAEYAAAKTDATHVKLIYHGLTPPAGFTSTPYGNYVKTVAIDQVSGLFLIKSNALYKGHLLEIASEANGCFQLAISDKQLAQQLGAQKVDRHDYRITVKQSDVAGIREERRDIPL